MKWRYELLLKTGLSNEAGIPLGARLLHCVTTLQTDWPVPDPSQLHSNQIKAGNIFICQNNVEKVELQRVDGGGRIPAAQGRSSGACIISLEVSILLQNIVADLWPLSVSSPLVINSLTRRAALKPAEKWKNCHLERTYRDV